MLHNIAVSRFRQPEPCGTAKQRKQTADMAVDRANEYT